MRTEYVEQATLDGATKRVPVRHRFDPPSHVQHWDGGLMATFTRAIVRSTIMTDRVGYDPVRDLTYIQPAVMRDDDRTEPRCLTCGRAFDCCCGPECPCGRGEGELMRSEKERSEDEPTNEYDSHVVWGRKCSRCGAELRAHRSTGFSCPDAGGSFQKER